ncbi:MAG: AAA family ATPase [Desulfomonilaceae bacterium]
MAIITISRGSYSKGKDVAEKVAERLGYECVSREILLEASEHFNIPEIKLVRALHDAPSVFERFTYGKEKYLAFLEATLLNHLRKDNIVYHGLAGHYFLRGVNHVLKVRILADLEDRIRLEMQRENISRDEARFVLKKDDHERRQWGLRLFGVDTSDPSLYDLVIHIHKITVGDAVDIICQTVGLEHFRTTPESQKALDDLVLAARVRARLVDTCPSVRVRASDQVVYVDTQAGPTAVEQLAEDLRALAEQVPGVKEVKIDVSPTATFFSD